MQGLGSVYQDENGYERDSKTKRLVHRTVCRKAHGKFPSSWHVHHVNGEKKDNRPENLIALPGACHFAIHKRFGFSEGLPDRWACVRLLSEWQAKKKRRKGKRKQAKKKPILKPVKPQGITKAQRREIRALVVAGQPIPEWFFGSEKGKQLVEVWRNELKPKEKKPPRPKQKKQNAAGKVKKVKMEPIARQVVVTRVGSLSTNVVEYWRGAPPPKQKKEKQK